MADNTHRMRKKVALRRRKIHILQALANSKAVRKSSLILDYIANICKLKLKLEAIRREYSSLIAVKKRCLLLLKNMRKPKAESVRASLNKRIWYGMILKSWSLLQVLLRVGLQQVKVQKIGDKFEVKVNCERREDGLVSILEALEKMGLDVLQARVSCDHVFSMEAFLVAQDQALGASDVAQAIVRAMEKQVGEDLVT